jgi:hypothetical protein
MPSSAADMTCIPVSSSDSKGKGDCIGSSSGQQLRVPGDTLPDQAEVISGGSSSGGGGGSSGGDGGSSSSGGGGSSSGGSSSVADTPEHSALHMPEQTISAQELFAEGVLAVDASEQVEALLERFMRVGWSLKHNGRKVTTMVGGREGGSAVAESHLGGLALLGRAKTRGWFGAAAQVASVAELHL